MKTRLYLALGFLNRDAEAEKDSRLVNTILEFDESGVYINKRPALQEIGQSLSIPIGDGEGVFTYNFGRSIYTFVWTSATTPTTPKKGLTSSL